MSIRWKEIAFLVFALLPFCSQGTEVEDWKMKLCVDTSTTPRHTIMEIVTNRSASCPTGTTTVHLPYRSSIEQSLAPLSVDDPKITKAVIAVHPAGSDPDPIFRAIRDEVDLTKTLVVAPQFLPLTAGVDDIVLQWPANEDEHLTAGWAQGDSSINLNGVRLSSFDVMDALIEAIATRNKKLKQMIVVGFSRGAQFTNRYNIATRVEEQYSDDVGRKIRFRYAMLAPGSYMYFNTKRINSGPCRGFNHYRYGTDLDGTGENHLGPIPDSHYIRELPNVDISFVDNVKKKKRFFLVGEQDNELFDQPCGEVRQGNHRMQRMEQYVLHIKSEDVNAATDVDGNITATSCIVSVSGLTLDHSTLVLRQNPMLNFLRLNDTGTSTDWDDFVENNDLHCNDAMSF